MVTWLLTFCEISARVRHSVSWPAGPLAIRHFNYSLLFLTPGSLLPGVKNNNNNSNHDTFVVLSSWPKTLREFTRFIWWRRLSAGQSNWPQVEWTSGSGRVTNIAKFGGSARVGSCSLRYVIYLVIAVLHFILHKPLLIQSFMRQAERQAT